MRAAIWTPELTKRLQDLYPETRNTELHKILGVSSSLLKSKAARMHLLKAPGFRSLPKGSVESTINMMEFVWLFPTTINSDLAKRYKTTKGVIKNIAVKYGLRKSAEHTNTGQFKPGHIPWSAGTKGVLKANSGSFKKGNIPHNTLDNGAITIRKMNNGTSYKWYRINQAEWELYQRVVWERAFGPIPKDHNIIFIDGDSLNCEPYNLMAVSQEELMERNTGSVGLTDAYIATQLSLKDKELRAELLKHPEIIEVKRESLKLKRAIDEQGKD